MVQDPILDAKFDAVQQLVDKRDFDGARAILKGMDDPIAREWEHKIDTLQPHHVLSNTGAHLVIAVVAFAIGGIALIVFFATLLDYRIDYSVRSIAIVLTIAGFAVAYVTNKLGRR
jgi:hypothetical protein